MSPESALSYRRWKDIDYRPVVADLHTDNLTNVLRPGGSVLDVGCGAGGTSKYLASRGYNVVGIDLNPTAIERARRKVDMAPSVDSARFCVADLFSYEPEGAFDAVLLIRVLTCFPELAEWEAACAKAKSMLAPAGYLYVHDFLRSPGYEERYEAGRLRGWRSGNFSVPELRCDFQFVAHHHMEAEAIEIAAGLNLISFEKLAGLSMSGNNVAMFRLLSQRMQHE